MPPKPIGADYVNNCLVSAGYIWCEILNKCVRTWIEACEYPSNCLTWNDGCNMCELNNGKLGGCTEMYCFTRNIPSCQVYEPEVSIMPVIDPLPPVINPFLGDGH